MAPRSPTAYSDTTLVGKSVTSPRRRASAKKSAEVPLSSTSLNLAALNGAAVTSSTPVIPLSVASAMTPSSMVAAPAKTVIPSSEALSVVRSLSVSKSVEVHSPPKRSMTSSPKRPAAHTAEELLYKAGFVPDEVVVVTPRDNAGLASAYYIKVETADGGALVQLDSSVAVGRDMVENRATTVLSEAPVVIESVKAKVHPLSAERMDMLSRMPASILGVGSSRRGSHVHTLHRTPTKGVEEVLMVVEQDGHGPEAVKTATLQNLGQNVYGSIRETVPIVSLADALTQTSKTMSHIKSANQAIATTAAKFLSEEMRALNERASALASAASTSASAASKHIHTLTKEFKSTLSSAESKTENAIEKCADFDETFTRKVLAATNAPPDSPARAILSQAEDVAHERVLANLKRYTEVAHNDLPALTSAFVASAHKTLIETQAAIQAFEEQAMKASADMQLYLATLKQIEAAAGSDLTSTGQA